MSFALAPRPRLAASTLLLWISAACGSPCPYVAGPKKETPCPIVRDLEEVHPKEKQPQVPSFFAPPRTLEDGFNGRTLSATPPKDLTERSCVSCDCSAQCGPLVPYDNWKQTNLRAYERLRHSEPTPYAIVVVPGYSNLSDGADVLSLRVQAALRLLQEGWVAAMLLSGGHQRGGFSEAAWMYRIVTALADQLHMDVKDRVFLEPCACHTSTNIRNALQILESMGIEKSLLVTEGDSDPGQASWIQELDVLADRDLHCFVGQVTPLRGRVSAATRGIAWLHRQFRKKCERTPGEGAWVDPTCPGHGSATVFLISPGGTLPDGRHVSAASCGLGSAAIARCETGPPGRCVSYPHPSSNCALVASAQARLRDPLEELAQFDPTFDCPTSGPVAPNVERTAQTRDLISTLQDVCNRDARPGPRLSKLLIKEGGTFATVEGSGGITTSGVANAFRIHPVAELRYTLDWKFADLSVWRHEIGLYGAFGGSVSGYTVRSKAGAETEAETRIGPQAQFGLWFRFRFGDAPIPYFQLGGGLESLHYFDLPARANTPVSIFADFGIYWLFPRVHTKIGFDWRGISEANTDFAKGLDGGRQGSFRTLMTMGYWFAPRL